MSVDWALIVDKALDVNAAHTNGPKLFPQKVGTASGGVGTKTDAYPIDYKEPDIACSHVPTVPLDFEELRLGQKGNSRTSSFKEPVGDGVEGPAAPVQIEVKQACRTCAHLRRPGLSEGYCGARDDLALAYGPGHPLRRCPDDRGAHCPVFERGPL